MHGTDLFVLGGIVVAGFACQWLAWRVRLPSILFLLVTGIAVGPWLGIVNPDELFGDLLQPMVSIAVAIILYEGSLTLKLAEIRGRGNVVRNLVTVGVLITWIVATLAARYILGWDLLLATLFGAVVTVSGPTVIMPLIRSIRPNKALSNIMRWEGILVDPIGAILAVLVFDFIIVTQTAATTTELFGIFGTIVVGGVILGVVAGHAFGLLLRNHWLPDFLRDYAALATVVLVFVLSESLASESGLLAVTIMGVWQANMRDVDFDDILDFKESLTLILVAGLFIVLAARIDMDALMSLGGGALLVLLLLQLFAGPARAAVASIGSDLSWQERAFLGWIFPRGIVAAAVSALFALRLESMQYPGAEKLVPMVFTIIVGTVVIQSLTGGLAGKLLGVTSPAPKGVLVVGASRAALFFARALHDQGHRVIIASPSWSGVSQARMAGIPVFYGSAVSSYAEKHLDLTGIGKLLAMSFQPGLNELACVKFRYDFGRDSVFTLPQHSESGHEKHLISGQAAGRVLFGGGLSVEELGEMLNDESEVKTTEITPSYSFADYRARHPDRTILFVSDADGNIRFPLDVAEMDVANGDKVTALLA